jgi:o-succinylbenzoate synthase
VLKPSLHGGFKKCDSIIQTATERNIGWWATSALESSIGLNAIAHWVYRWKPILPQGLGTGQIFTNNLLPAWTVENGQLIHTGTLSFPLEWTR